MLNYHHLFYFWKVAKLGSIARASAELKVTQPTISEQLRALETSLDHKLFDRVGRSLVLTETGQRVFDQAEQIFLLGDDLVRSLQEKPSARILRVGADPLIPASLIAKALREYRNVVFDIQHTSTAHPYFDLFLTPFRPSRGNRKPIFDLPTVFVSKSSAPLSLQKLALPTFAQFEEFHRYVRAQKLKLNVSGQFPTPDLALTFAQQGHGACAAPDLKSAYPGLKVIARTPTIRWRVFKLEKLKSRPI